MAWIEINPYEVIKLSHYKETHNILTRLALKNASSETIINVFSTIINNPVVLFDRDFNCLHSTDRVFTHITSSNFLQEYCLDELYYYLQASSFEGAAEPINHWIVPIKVFDITKVYLSVVEKNHPMNEMDFIALENAMTVLSLEMVNNLQLMKLKKDSSKN